MTAPELDAWLENRFDITAPVSLDDLRYIKDKLREVAPAGIPIDVVLRGPRIEVTLGGGGPAPCTRWIDIKGAEPEPVRGLASGLNALGARQR